jgi:phosphinothricin acetyltransferase
MLCPIMLIRTMQEQDWAHVANILREGIDTGIATFQLEVPTYDQWNATHLVPCRMVAELPGQDIVGWAALSAVSSRVAYRGVAELSIYVGTRYRRQGIGHTLLSHLIVESEKAGFWTLQAVILSANEASLALHLGCGFRVVGMRERIGRLADGRWSDTLLLERRSSNPDYLS